MKKILASLMICLVLLVALSGSVSAQAQIGITDCTELQDMRNNLAGDYVLLNDIDCSDTVNWNGGAGFEPIGRDTDSSTWVFEGTKFSGSFDGDGYTISNLYINRPNEHYVGLFGYTAPGSEIRDVALDNVDIEGRSRTGGVSGYNDGTISNVSVTIATSGSISAAGYLGGGGGLNYGFMDGVHVAGAVTITSELGNYTGGVVGLNYGYIIDSSFNG